MQEQITISLPEDVSAALDLASREDGVSRDDVIGQAIKNYLFVRKFRLLRESMTAKAVAQGISTDQDVFDLVS